MFFDQDLRDAAQDAAQDAWDDRPTLAECEAEARECAEWDAFPEAPADECGEGDESEPF